MAMKLHNASGGASDRASGRDDHATATSLTREAIPCPADYAQIGGGGRNAEPHQRVVQSAFCRGISSHGGVIRFR